MGRQPCCDKAGLKKGPWTAEEDKKLITFILNNGQCCWRAVPKLAGLLRCGKSCRLRWINYLRPDLKRGLLSDYEEKMVIDLHAQLGNKWSKIASHLPGRTDNEIKNHWNTHIKKKLRKMGVDPVTHQPLSATSGGDDEEDEDHKTKLPESPKGPSIFEVVSEKEQSFCKDEQSTVTVDQMEVKEGFSIDEVPLLQPHEILVAPLSSTSCSSSSSNGFLSSNVSNNNINSILDDVDFLPAIDWQCDYIFSNMGFWEDDFLSTTLDSLFNNDTNNNINNQLEKLF
ncbi:unnamed protein product [Cuscuta europaea]|uniref:Uncharacterized protein n=1 Tax=Cuscuta europaea TaxID=41803 RepID=A0A9P1EIB6_CUSEU|nr:unnamed protein product [Cuscuta europaea]